MAKTIGPDTLAADENGVHLQPKHIQQTLRQLAGIENHDISQMFPLDAEGIKILG